MSQLFNIRTTGEEIAEAFASRIQGKIRGLGAQNAIDFASKKPDTLVLLGRNITKIQPVIDSIKTISPKTKVHFVHVDLVSIDSVRAAAQEVNTLVSHIDILINSAAVMALPTYQIAPNFKDVELQFAGNHLGHFLLTNLLVPLFATGGSSKIVNVSSEGHAYAAPKLDTLSDINYGENRKYDAWEAYGMSKLANILFTRSLALKLKSRGVRAYAVHPGFVIETNLADNLESTSDAGDSLARFIAQGRVVPQPKTIPEGSATTLVAALDPKFDDVSGAYLNDCQLYESTPFSSNPKNAESLWKISEEVVGQKFNYST